MKLESGSLTDQRPAGQHRVRPWLADILPTPLREMGCEVVALEVAAATGEMQPLRISFGQTLALGRSPGPMVAVEESLLKEEASSGSRLWRHFVGRQKAKAL